MATMTEPIKVRQLAAGIRLMAAGHGFEDPTVDVTFADDGAPVLTVTLRGGK